MGGGYRGLYKQGLHTDTVMEKKMEATCVLLNYELRVCLGRFVTEGFAPFSCICLGNVCFASIRLQDGSSPQEHTGALNNKPQIVWQRGGRKVRPAR